MKKHKATRFGQRCQNVNVPLPPIVELTFRQAILRLDGTSFKNQYLKNEVFSKYVSPDTDPADVRRQRAINKWLAVEQQNSATEDRLLSVDPEFLILPAADYRSFTDKVCSIIESIIGSVPPADTIFGGFSGGASTSRLRTDSHPARKFVGKADVTPRAVDNAMYVLTTSPAWLQHGQPSVDVVNGNVMFTVPKAVDQDRVAAKEPDLNMFMQKGVGDFIRRRLMRVGVDLNDQSRNRAYARDGSRDGSLATLDLSSASDSVTRELVFQCLPIHWFALLDSLRSPITIIDGEEHVNTMFSSMGNGFTFELESLLFYAITRAVCYFEGTPGIVSVYGDDIICPTDAALQVMSALAFMGFQPNSDKSHFTGFFRESCGGHFLGGYDVTPFYVKKPITHLNDLILLLNKIRRWSDSRLDVLWDDLKDFWFFGSSFVPRRLWGGRDFGSDSQLVTNDAPQDRLVRRERRISLGVGGYLLSLFAGSSGASLTDQSVTLGNWRFAKVQFGPDHRVSEWIPEDSHNPK